MRIYIKRWLKSCVILVLLVLGGQQLFNNTKPVKVKQLPNKKAHKHLVAFTSCDERPNSNECVAMRNLGYEFTMSRNRSDVDVSWTFHKLEMLSARIVNTNTAIEVLYRKSQLVMIKNVSVIPPAFKMPEQYGLFIRQARKMGKDVLWLAKNPKHGGVKLINPTEVDKRRIMLVQEFKADPLLISNRKFDIGAFIIATSVAPLRMYMYKPNFKVKFCKKEYLPFDKEDNQRYAVLPENVRVWEIPALKNLAGEPGSRNDADVLSDYLDQKGYNVQTVKDNILAAVTEVGCKAEKLMNPDLYENLHKKPEISFELLRFDLSLQSDLSIFIMEINTGPDIYFKDGQHRMYMNLLNDLMMFVGFVNASWTEETVAYRINITSVKEKEINVDHKDCEKCTSEDCTLWKCRVCWVCLDSEDRKHLIYAVLEHRRNNGWIRAVPPPFKNQTEAMKWIPTSDPLYKVMTAPSQMMFLWFHRKCIQDVSWCM